MKAWVARVGPWLASATLLGVAFPPANLLLLVFVALVPWFLKLRDCDGKTAFWQGYGFGFFYFGFQMFWVVMFVGEWTGSWVMATLPWLVCAFLAGWIYAGTAWLVAKAFRLGWIWAVPLVWSGSEAFRAYMPTLAFPWGIASLPLARVPWAVQSGAWGTIFLVSAWVVLVNLLVMEWFYPKGEGVNRRRVQAMLAVAVAVFGAGAVRYVTVPGGEKKVFTLGQPGVDMAFLTPEEERTALANATGDLVAGAILQKSDLLVLPEGYAGRVSGDPVGTPLGFEPPVPVIMGGQRDTGVEKVYQTAYVWDREKWSFGDKTRLVVFGEFVPFRDQLPVLQNFRVPAGDLVAGTELKTLSIRGMTVGPLICFEGVFPDLAVGHSNMGAQVLVQMSIDDWYERTPAHEQLWLSTVWRSIESGLPVMRVGGRGKSLATDSRGNVVVDVPVGDRVSARAEVVVPSGSDAFGGRLWFVGVCWLACLGVAAWRKGSNMGE